MKTKKETFCNLLNSLKSYLDKINKFHILMSELTEEFIWSADSDLVGHIIDSLDWMVTKHDCSSELVSWFVFETNFGRKPMEAYEADGETVDISTPELLYDFITGCHKDD